MVCPIESLARRVRGVWIAKRSGVMWRTILTGRKRNGRAILGCRGIASGITCEHSASAVKKTTGYKERSLIKRKAYLRLRERYARRGKTFVYIDESGFTPSANRRYAYAPKGQRVYGLVAGKRRPRTSLIAARIGESFEEPFLFQGTCNANVFNAWLERQLCPRLNENHVVVMDNVPFHKGRNTQERIEQRGATLLFLPPYSPDLNPIENDFAAIKINREYHENETLDNIVSMYK
jgi:putative transposase